MKIKILSILAALPAIVFVSFGAVAGGTSWHCALFWNGPDGRPWSQHCNWRHGCGFPTLGISVLTGLITQRRTWIIVPAIFMALAALGRVLAWAFHDATLAISMIGPEILIAPTGSLPLNISARRKSVRRLLAATMLLAGLLSQAASADDTSVNSRRPNVLLILADDWAIPI